jgi:hypothetical protein
VLIVSRLASVIVIRGCYNNRQIVPGSSLYRQVTEKAKGRGLRNTYWVSVGHHLYTCL